MYFFRLSIYLLLAAFISCRGPVPRKPEFAAVSQVDSGKPVAVMLTAYSTTLLADGKDQARLRIALTDSLQREITSLSEAIQVFVTGDGKVTGLDGQLPELKTDTSGNRFAEFSLQDGLCELIFVAGTKPDKVKVEARCGKLWPGAHEIHTLPPGIKVMKPSPDQINKTGLPVDDMIGADISWLPQTESEGKKFYENGIETDALTLLKSKGFNYIRLRIFVNPENEKGYSPGKGFCDLPHTLVMAKRIKEAGMKFLLDFHYSDYWADPQQQYKPKAWENLSFNSLQDTVTAYTARVLNTLKAQGTLPDMVQVGNEINHGLLWPDGHISNPDNLAALLMAGAKGVKQADDKLPVMMHIALGGQNQEAVFWLDNMIARDVEFDIIGISYYPRWHGTLDDLKFNLTDLVNRYKKPVNVVEYSDFKKEVHDIVFSLPGGMGKGAAIWEPLNHRSGLFDRDGNTTPLFEVYKALAGKYLK